MVRAGCGVSGARDDPGDPAAPLKTLQLQNATTRKRAWRPEWTFRGSLAFLAAALRHRTTRDPARATLKTLGQNFD
jgi:hypothetical protein